VAHILDIPIAVEFTSSKDRWVLATALVRGWSGDFEDPLHMVVSARDFVLRSFFSASGDSALRPHGLVVAMRAQESDGKMSSVRNENLYRIGGLESAEELATTYAPNAVLPNLDEAGMQFPILWAPYSPAGWHRERDPWQMREEFLRLKKDHEALLNFANKWGRWDLETLQPVYERGTPRNISDYRCPHFILPDQIWKLQDSYRAALRAPAEDWLSKFATLRGLEKRSTFPYLTAKSLSCKEAIEITITIDLLKKVKFRVCARPDCDNVFSLDSKHKRKYCQQYCGHLESVRKQRVATRRTKSKKFQGD
jgi:hypothetical protein